MHTTQSPGSPQQPTGIAAASQNQSPLSNATDAPQPWRLARAAVRVTGQAVAAPYLKIIGGAMVVIGFGTSIFGFGFILGCVGAGLLFASASASCVSDITKDPDEREGQVNVLLKSAGWATVGSLLLIPYWIGCCLDRSTARHNTYLYQYQSPTATNSPVQISQQGALTPESDSNPASTISPPKSFAKSGQWNSPDQNAAQNRLNNSEQPVFTAAPNDVADTSTGSNSRSNSLSEVIDPLLGSSSESDPCGDLEPDYYPSSLQTNG